MSNWPGNLIRKTPVTPAGPLQNGAAPGIWSLAEASYWTKQGLWPTAGNFLAVEDVFSTYLYTGNNGAQSISNGLNLSGQGGLVWLKNRGSALNNILIDTAQGSTFAGGKNLVSNNTNAAGTIAANTFQFDSTGFSFGSAASGGAINASGNNYVSWSFREAPKFFDVLTYTGNSTSGGPTRTLSHNLGVAPGMVIIKCTTTGYAWVAWHRSVAGNGYLNSTAAFADDGFGITVTSTTVSFAAGNGATNANGDQYVMYLFAHDTTSDGIIQCGSYTGTGAAGNFVSLGWEPQWVMIKRASGGTGDWRIIDNMRGLVTNTTNGDATLNANTSEAEFNDATVGNYPFAAANPTGFTLEATSGPSNASGSTYIYIAIRRGPMRTPTSGTSVFAPVLATASNGTGATLTTGFPIDLQAINYTPGTTSNSAFLDRLRGVSTTTTESGNRLSSSNTDSETSTSVTRYWDNTGFQVSSGYASSRTIYWNFRRAPSFFDEVCYTGTGVNGQTYSHNLGVVPELMIVKGRGIGGWIVYAASQAATKFARLDLTNAFSASSTLWNDTAPTSSVFTVGTSSAVNGGAGQTYVAYLFASCPGVSKVGSYTGTGTTQTINCGFTTGARFVLIKRTDSTGDWYVWDSARGIVAGNDPYLLLNSTAAEVTSTDYIDTDNSGFQISSTAPAAINANGGSFIYLAIS